MRKTILAKVMGTFEGTISITLGEFFRQWYIDGRPYDRECRLKMSETREKAAKIINNSDISSNVENAKQLYP